MLDQARLQFLNDQLGKVSAQLGEHFEAVQILAVANESGQTILMAEGAGNIFTRHGMMEEYTAQLQVRRAMNAAASMRPPPADF